MSDHTTILGFVGVSIADADALGDRLKEHLLAREIIVDHLADNSLDGPGYEPGRRVIDALDGSEAYLEEQVRESSWNGLRIVAGEDAAEDTDLCVEHGCPSCGAVGSEAIESTDYVSGVCRVCRATVALDAAQLKNPEQLNLAITVANWPPLAPSLVAELEALVGHRSIREYLHL